MYKKSFFLILVAICVALQPVRADKVWHMVVGCEKIPVTAIDYAVSQEGADGFDIVLLDGGIVQGVTRSSFSFEENAGIQQRPTDREVVIGPFAGQITIKGLRPGSLVTVYDSMGRAQLEATAGTEPCRLDVSALAPGIYVLRSPNSAVKFRKD